MRTDSLSPSPSATLADPDFEFPDVMPRIGTRAYEMLWERYCAACGMAPHADADPDDLAWDRFMAEEQRREERLRALLAGH